MKKLNIPKTLLLGFGFFAISVTWSVYNSFMPKILSNFIQKASLIGVIMTIDNWFGLIVQPTVGVLSDNINTRFGRRMPFILVGMPLAIIFIILLSMSSSLKTIIIFLVLTNLSMSIFRSPVIALMPDITYPEKRSMANSIINFMGGIGSVIAYFVGSKLWDKDPRYPFFLAAILMTISLIILFTFIKEKRDALFYETSEEIKKPNFIKSFKATSNKRNVVFLLGAILFWFIGYNGVETFFSLYGEKYLGISISASALSFTFISLSFLVFAIPAGIIGTKLGKGKTIKIGIIGLIICFIIAYFLKDINAIRIVFVIAGINWALININSYPFVTDMAPIGETGTYTGFYYFVSSAAAILSPPILGGIIDSIGYSCMFGFAAFFFILAFISLSQVKYIQQD
ncbi:MAG: MFS transporter [Bacillota bacterium]|nr:MFS transporter [Bacillota bacterium]